MTPYLRFIIDLPEGEPVEMFVPELLCTRRPFVYDLHSVPTNMVYDTRVQPISTLASADDSEFDG